MPLNQNTDAYRQELINKIKENYLSVALGFLVFLVAVTLIYRPTSPRQKNKIQEEQAQEQLMQQKKNVHVVKAGESVSSIARDVLGSLDYTKDIVSANNLKNPEEIEVGQELTLPEVGKLASSVDEAEPTDTAVEPTEAQATDQKVSNTAATTGAKITGNTYTVQKGDTLMSIAERAYGSRAMYTKIMSANNLKSPNRIETGMVLKLPR